MMSKEFQTADIFMELILRIISEMRIERPQKCQKMYFVQTSHWQELNLLLIQLKELSCTYMFSGDHADDDELYNGHENISKSGT